MNKHLGERTSWIVIIICLLVYLFSAKGYTEGLDSTYSVQTAQEIVAHGQLAIPYAAGATLRGPDGKSYSKYGLGLPLYYVPWVAVADALSKHIGLPAPELTGFLLSFANIPFAVLTLILFCKLLKLFEVNGTYAWLLLLGLGLGTLMWRYACYDFSEGMQMGLLILAVYGVVRGSPKAIACAGVGFGALFLVKLVFVAFFPLFLLYLFIRPENLRHRIRNAALFTFPVLLADCFLAWMNAVRFGNPLESGYGNEGHQFFPFQLWHTIPQLLGSLDKGLFIFCPILLLGIFGWKEFALRYRPEAILCGGLLLGNLVLMGGMVRVGRGLVLGATISSSVDSTMAAAGRILVSGAAVATAVLAFCSIDGALDHSPDTGHSSERPGNSSNQI